MYKTRKQVALEEALQELRDAREQIEEKNRELEAQSRFFANISHEFRTPLTLIIGPLEQIVTGNPDKETRTRANLMLRNSRRLLDLVNQLLALAKFDSGKMQLRASLQNIVSFVKNIAMCFNETARKNNVGFGFIGGLEDVPVYFDPDKLEKIVTNLLSNAFNHTPVGGNITLSVREAAEHPDFPSGGVEISVFNTGPGIPPDQLPHIFDRFFRGRGGHDYIRRGTGIGLALTKELVELHQGKIEVRSTCRTDDSGETEFILRLPMGCGHLRPEETVKQPSAAVGTKDMGSEPGTEEEKKSIPLVLVVEPSADVRVYARGALESFCKVVEAVDAEDGTRKAKDIIPDIIISGIAMPRIDGYDFCRALKYHVLTSHIPVILLNAGVSDESALRVTESCADDIITRPFSTALLAARVKNLLELRRRLQMERTGRLKLQPGELAVLPMDDDFYKTLQDTVERHISDPDFNVEVLSRELNISHATLYRKVCALTGKTPVRFIRCCRLHRAARLLEAGAGSVSDVAREVGFPDVSYFARCFKEQFHQLPSGYLPRGNGDAEGPETFAPNVADLVTDPGEPEKEVILVVEDDTELRAYILDMLEPLYRVVGAADGADGIAAAVEIIPDLVISDIKMPRADGFRLCSALKNDVRTSHIPVILLTGVTSEESRIRGLECLADDYLAKPFNAGVLRARIRHLIQLRAHLQEKRNREIKMLPVSVPESDTDREFTRELHTAVKTGISDPEFNVAQLAKALYMSSASLYRKILGLTGETPSQYIRSYRLREAARLLKRNSASIGDVAFEVGFNSPAYFTRCFKELFHRSPSEYAAAES